jgi:hypothetical protein
MRKSKKIVNAYDKIFSEDPLLSEERYLKEYCGRLLNNILENRTLHTAEPVQFDLHVEKDHANFDRPAPKEPPKLKQAEIDAYRAAYLRREPFKLSKRSLDRLKDTTMVMNPRTTWKRALKKLQAANDTSKARGPQKPPLGKRPEPPYPEHSEAKTDLATAASGMDARLRIAAVGYRVRISAIPEQAPLGEDLCMLAPIPDRPMSDQLPETVGARELGRTHLTKTADLPAWQNTVERYISLAQERGSHVIFLPEFAMPAADKDGTFDKRIATLCGNAKYDHFVFTGSRHEGSYNRGLVFQTRDGKLNERLVWHYKVASARTLGENILGPHHNKVPSYPSYAELTSRRIELAISIALCYDAFDPSVFLRLVRQGLRLRNEAWQSSLILVPSFNPSEVFVALLRDLSFVTRSTVVYVNALHGNAKMFICGFAVSDFIGNLEKIKRKIAQAQKALAARRRAVGESKDGSYRSRRALIIEIDERSEALTDLEDALNALDASRGLDHMITVERCEECERADRQHSSLSRCERDVLYYNIDPKLLRALTRYRENFINDSHLPGAFRNR